MDTSCPPVLRQGLGAIRKRIGTLVLAMLAAVGTAAADELTPPPESLPAANLTAPNATPLRAVRVFRVYGWRALDARTGVIWLGVDEPYLIRVGADCRDAAKSAPSALALRGTHLVPGRDRLVFSPGACVIDSLLLADRNKLRASSITPGTANAVRLIQEAVPRKSQIGRAHV